MITDHVRYEGLKPGVTYEAVLSVYDRSTARLCEEIEPVRQEFTAEANGSGEVAVRLTLDGTPYAGHILVMYEEVYVKPTEAEMPDAAWEPEMPVAEHLDPDDADQQIHVPLVQTQAEDSRTGDHLTYAEANAVITDTVHYEGLIAGKDYVLEGRLVDASTGNDLLVNGEPVTVQKPPLPMQNAPKSSGTYLFQTLETANMAKV